MATPYIELLSKRSISEQLQRHYDQTNLIYNVEDIVKAQTAEYNNTLRDVSREQSEIMRASTEAICGTLGEGFEMLADGLQGVENAIYRLTNTLDTHLKVMIEQQRYNNILSENIALLSIVPDSQKERQANIKKGLKFFNDSLRDPSVFEYSLRFFQKAYDDDDTDYFVSDKIGLIYLCSKQHKNYDEAIKYFTNAVKFSKLDTHPNSIRLANFLVGDITKPLDKQNATIDYIKYLTGQSLLWIAVAYYEQAKFSESIKFVQEAYLIAPTLLDAGFHLAKSLAATNQNKKAAEVLEPIIRQDRNYSLRTLSDIDLAPKKEINNTLEKLRQETFNEASSRLNKCKSEILSYSKGKDLLNKIERLITNHKTYLACKKAIDLLNKKNSYAFNEAIGKNNSGKWEASVKPMTFNFSIEELVDYEILLKQKLNIVKELIANKESKAELLSKLNSTQSNFKTSSTELKEQSKMTNNIGLFTLGGIVSFIIGLIMLNTNHGWGAEMGFGDFFQGLIGLVLLLAGLVGGGLALIGFIEAGVKNISLSNKTDKISSEEQELRDNITEKEVEIQRLENS